MDKGLTIDRKLIGTAQSINIVSVISGYLFFRIGANHDLGKRQTSFKGRMVLVKSKTPVLSLQQEKEWIIGYKNEMWSHRPISKPEYSDD